MRYGMHIASVLVGGQYDRAGAGTSGRERARNVAKTGRIAPARGPVAGENRRAVPAVVAVAILPNRSLRKGMP